MKKLYRYEIGYSSYDSDTEIVLREFPILRQTEKTYFISYYGYKEKRVLKDAYSTFAYDNIEYAKEHFLRRTRKRIQWYKYFIKECEKGLELATQTPETIVGGSDE